MRLERTNEAAVNGFSPVTTPVIVYEESLLHYPGPDTIQENLPNRFLKRIGILSELVLVSSLMALTTPVVCMPTLRRLSSATCLSILEQTEYVSMRTRRITLREARQIALRAFHEFEEGLRRDHIQESRLMQLAVSENES
jgi:hypothetical protein